MGSLLLFFLMGPLLTLGVLIASGLRHSQNHARYYEYQAALRMGQELTMDSVEYRRPRDLRFLSVKMQDHATQTPFFHAPEINIQYISSHSLARVFPELDNPHAHSGFWQITIPLSELKLESLSPSASAALFQEIVRKILAHSNELAKTPTLVIFEDVGVFRKARETSKNAVNNHVDHFRFVKCLLHKTSDGIQAQVTFQLPSVSEFETQKITFKNIASHRTTEIEWDTGMGMVPCDLVSYFCTFFQACSPEGKWSGIVTVSYPNEGATFRRIAIRDARFENLRLDDFAKKYTPYTVRGNIADLRIRAAIFEKENFFLDGCVNVTNGVLDTTLFRRLVDRFALKVSPENIPESESQIIPFDSLALFFQLDRDGALFWPEESWNRNLMYRRGNSFRTENMNVLFPQENPRPISYHALLSLLAPPDANIIPWTPLSQQIFSMLPADALQQEQNVNTAIAVAETEKQESSNFFPRTTEPSPMPASPFPALANPIVMPESSPSPYFRDNGEHVEGLNSF